MAILAVLLLACIAGFVLFSKVLLCKANKPIAQQP